MLEASKRTASAEGTDTIRAAHVNRMFETEQSDSLGFDEIEQKYLRILQEENGPVRLNLITAQMGVPRPSVEMLENDFIRLQLVTKSEKGRMLTPKGIEHLAASTR